MAARLPAQTFHAGGPHGGGGGGGGQLVDNPPCNTLFVGNLAETINEAELMSLFQPHPVSVVSFGRGGGRHQLGAKQTLVVVTTLAAHCLHTI
jgi:hypothetical protein